MEIKGKKILMLGGWGLVGMAVIRELAKHDPKQVIVLSLRENEAKDSCEQLRKEFPAIEFTEAWGNIFVRESFKDFNRNELMENPENRDRIIKDVLEKLDDEVLKNAYLYKLIDKFKPDVIIDSVNSATGLAYQDVYTGYYKLKKELSSAKDQKELTDGLQKEVEKLLASLSIPQFIRHIQILHQAMVDNKTGLYIKVGTTGTGGMGLNIPYTHSEDKPSRVLLSKSSLAGAHSMLLFLMGRTPDGPIIKEIKPAAAIAWKKIAYGEIKKGGKAVELYDCKLENAEELGSKFQFAGNEKWEDKKETLKSVYIDTGENGIFSRGEFETITTAGQMEFVTPEEISNNVIMEIRGASTGTDIINALDNSVMGPTYRAGYLRHNAITEMINLEKAHGNESIAFELLGPPRLSKLLFEAKLLKNTCGTLASINEKSSDELCKLMENELLSNDRIRMEAISIGIPVLMSDGKKLLRGPNIKVPVQLDSDEVDLNNNKVNEWANAGWIDLRISNMDIWKQRIAGILKQINAIPKNETSSRFHHGIQYWNAEKAINIGKVVSWIFIYEEEGLRIKR